MKTIQSSVRTAVHSLQKLQLWFLPIIITIMRELNLLLVALRTENRRLMEALRKEALYPPFFSLITCGLYVIYWIIKVTNEMNTLLNRKNATGGLMTIIFTILTCGLYGFYWAYKLGDNVDLLKGNRSGNTGILFLVVYIFGFGIINVALAQDAINDKLDGIY